MIKLLRYVKRRPDMTQEQFKDYWLNNHVELQRWMLANTPMLRIEVLFATGEMVGGKTPPFDSLVQGTFPNIEDMHAVMSSDVPKRLLADETNFVDQSAELIRVVTDPYVVAEKQNVDYHLGSAPMIKLLRYVKRRPDLTQAQFKDYWLNKHVELQRWMLANTPMKRIEVFFATGEMVGGKKPPFDSLVQGTFPTIEDMHAVMSSDIPKRLLADEANFVDQSAELIRVVTEAYVVAEK
jgi:uncharacterized protein (TIGR02118 family)